jgi:hypothetical protein
MVAVIGGRLHDEREYRVCLPPPNWLAWQVILDDPCTYSRRSAGRTHS